jgi:hypothetical protein
MNQIQQEDSDGLDLRSLRSCLALDQELENEDASKSIELSQILMRLFFAFSYRMYLDSINRVFDIPPSRVFNADQTGFYNC